MNIKDIKKYGLLAQGKAELISFLKHKLLTRKEAIKAKCYECNNGYADGKKDCKVECCPLYNYMPYNPNKRKKQSTLTEEQREKKSEHMRTIQRTHFNRTAP